MRTTAVSIFSALFLLTATTVWAAETETVSWGRCLNQPAKWYKTDEAVRIADNVLLFQRDSGGWQKNVEMARVLTDAEKERLKSQKPRTDSTLDNGATHTQMRFLAKVGRATGEERFKQGFLKAMDYLLAAQYPNGGWPQCYPLRSGYHNHITFNDNAMIGAMRMLRDVAEKKTEYAFVDAARRKKAEDAVQRGIDCILKCQIVVNGRRTAWCQQHDEKTFAPRPARIYEHPSICGNESVGVVRFLMEIDDPSPQVIAAVEGAVAWFQKAKIDGIRMEKRDAPKAVRGFDYVIVKDADAAPMWARFYEIGTNRPIFSDRRGTVLYSMSEISVERRTGYSWYGQYAAGLLEKDYPTWKKQRQ